MGINLCYTLADKSLADGLIEMFELENIPTVEMEKALVHLFLLTDHSIKDQGILNQLHQLMMLDKKFITLNFTNKTPSEEVSFYISTTQWFDMKKKDSSKVLLKMILHQLR